MADKLSTKGIYKYIKMMKTMTLVNILISLALLCMLIGWFFRGSLPPPVQGIFLGLSGLFVGLSGIPIIVRKEVNYTVFSLEGPLAILVGVVMFLSGFIFSILLFIGILKSLLYY